MDIWITNPLEDVFRTSKKPYLGYYNRIEDHIVELARNSRESIQLAINAGEVPMQQISLEMVLESGEPDNGITFECGGVKLIHNSSNSINIGSKVMRAKLPGELPQAIINGPKDIIEYRQSGSFFIPCLSESICHSQENLL